MIRAGKCLAAALAGAAVFLCSGCGLTMDIDNLVRPPRSDGEHLKIQQVVDDYVQEHFKDEKNAVGTYTLKYPRSGDVRYRSSIILKDINDDGADEALVLYHYGAKSDNMRLHLLGQEGGKWRTLDDIEGFASDIERVAFSDIRGNAELQLVTGWMSGDSPNQIIVMYSLSGGKFSPRMESVYTEWVITDMTGDGRDDVLLLTADTANRTASAHLWGLSGDGTLSELGSTNLDRYIQSFSSVTVETPPGAGFRAVYADGVKAGGTVTEIIYWNGKFLAAPLYDNTKKITERSFRPSDMASRDIDTNQRIEWPVFRDFFVPPPSSEASQTLRLTDWMYWDFETGTARKTISCIMNEPDHYYLRIDDSLESKITALYDRSTRTLHMYETKDNRTLGEILVIRTVHAAAELPAPTDADGNTYSFEVLEIVDDMRFDVWYPITDTPLFSYEQINYMFTFL